MADNFPMDEPISVQEIKPYLRGVDGNEEDLLIESLIAAARNYCETEMGVKIYTNTLESNGEIVPLPSVVHSAMLIMACFLFESRGSDAKEVPGAVSAMLRLSPYYYRTGAA